MALIEPGTHRVSIYAQVAAAFREGDMVQLANNAGTPRLEYATAWSEADAVVTAPMSVSAGQTIFENQLYWLGPCFVARAGEALALTDAGANLIEAAAGELVKSGTAEASFILLPHQSVNNSTAAAAADDRIVVMRKLMTLDTDT